MPLYLKSHSYGEYVFDWSWADAWQRSGLHYYPKLVSAIPFTPATGPRLCIREDADPAATWHAALGAVQGLAKERGFSSSRARGGQLAAAGGLAPAHRYPIPLVQPGLHQL